MPFLCFAQPDEQKVREQRRLSNQAIAQHDTASLGRYWLDDLHVVTSRSVSLDGKQANLRAFQNEFNAKEKLLYVRTTSTVEVFQQWNMAAEYGKWVGTWKANGASIKVTGTYYAKWHKMNGVWKIKAEIYTPLTCEGDDYCKAFEMR